jgi:transcriptional regulator with PAS, ATPase and Fis domain
MRPEKVWPDEALLDENLMLNSFFGPLSDLPLGIIVIDRRTDVRFFNAMAGYFLGIQPSLALGKPIDKTVQDLKITEVLSTGLPHYDRQKLINGRLLKCSLVPIELGGQVIFAAEFMQDYTEKISLETQLAELRTKYDMLDMLLDNSFEELGAVDKDGRLTYLTQKSARNLGIDRDEALGRDMTSLDPRCLLKKVAKSGVPEVAEIARPRKQVIPVMVVPLYKGDSLEGAVCKSIFSDLGEAKNFARRLGKLDDKHARRDHKNTPGFLPKQVCGCRFTFGDIMGRSKAILSARQRALRVAQGDSNILITGDSGTGKELFAQAIHMASLRKSGPFIVVNCAGIPENLLESELFGYEFGSFTGARKGGKPGKFELAHNGTIFLDEAADMSMGMQAKLLRVIQEKEFERVGGTVSYEIDVRIIAATNKDLWEMVQRGQFREDLYYRLDVVNIHIPPLRERLEDLPLLIDHFIPRIQKRTHSNVKGVSEQVLRLFMNYDWPGNVREIRNVLEGAMNLNTGELIDIEAIPSRPRRKMIRMGEQKFTDTSLRILPFEDRETAEKALIEHAMSVTNGNKRQAAIRLKMSRATLYNKLKKYRIQTGPAAEGDIRTASD